jgi:hypothetical protein
MNRLKTVNLVFLIFLIVTSVFAGCSSKEKCSADLECKDGYYCGDNRKCTEFKDEDYTISFEDLEDGSTITTADDIDRSTGDIEISVTVLVKDSKPHVGDDTEVTLSVKNKVGNITTYTGKIADGKVTFGNVLMPEGQTTVESWLTQNSSVKAIAKVTVRKMNVDLFYMKGGAGGDMLSLDGAEVDDDDRYDKDLDDKFTIYITGDADGLEQGENVKLMISELQDKPVAEAEVDKDGKVNFSAVEIPVWKNVRMTIVSGEYSKSISFSVDSSLTCGFMMNVSNGDVFGIADDENQNLNGLQFNLKLSEITGCGLGSKVSIYIGDESDEELELFKSIFIGGSSVEDRITISASSSPDDLKKMKVVIEDSELEIFGHRTVSNLLVDLDPPFGEISFPAYDQIITAEDDLDSETSGIQVNLTGSANDIVTTPVTVVLKLQDVVIATEQDVAGIFSVPYTFPQSLQDAVLEAEITDGAGNSFIASQIFSVDTGSTFEFYSICGKTGGQLVNGMWLNADDDEDTDSDKLECTVVVKVPAGSLSDSVSLAVGDGVAQEKDIDEDGEVSFEIELEDDKDGIDLTAKLFLEDSEKDEIVFSVRVDTVPPVATVTNNLLLNSGESTSSPDITFNFSCDDAPCIFNSQHNDELTDLFTADNSRMFTGLADGTHTITVRSRDAAGNTSEAVVFTWTVDTDNPETTITKDPGAGTTANFALFEFASSKESFKFFCQLQKDGSDFMPVDGTWEECNLGKRDYYGLSEGTYLFRVYAQDSLGNNDPSPAEHTWVVGSVAPVTTITDVTPEGSPVNSDSVEFQYEATVESTYECRLEKGGIIIENWTDCDSKTKIYSGLEDGVYVFKVKATAVYGTPENTPASYTWTIDTTPPKVRFTAKPAVESPYDSGTFSFECVDESTPCTFECELDTLTVDCSAMEYSYSGLSGGDHRFTVEATDAAGNKSVAVTDIEDEFLNDYTWKIDDTVLGVQIDTKPDLHVSVNNATFEFSSNKAATFECKLDSGDFADCSGGDISYSDLSEGAHTFTVKASFGGDEAEETYTWNVNTTPPVVTIDLGPDDPTSQTGAIFNFSANEPVAFECKLDTDADWSSCNSPKLYPTSTFGIMGTEQTYTFTVRATDLAGNSAVSAPYTWTVDLEGPAIEWISPAPGTDGKVVVGKSHDVYSADPNIYAVSVSLKISGSDPGQPINVTGFKTPPGYNIVNVNSSAPKTYTLTIGLQDGFRVNNPLTITVEDDSGASAVLEQLVIVNTEMPTITWAYPGNNHKFIANTTAPQFIFNVWNAGAGNDVELVDADTGDVVATKKTVGSSTGFQEYVTFNPTLEDRCGQYKFFARMYDDLDEMWHYTNSVIDDELKTVRSVTVDRTPAVIGAVEIPGITGSDRVLNREDNLNPDSEGGMQIDITVNISDPQNSPGDSGRTVRLFTNNGVGSDAATLLATLHDQGDVAVFEKVALQDCCHILRVEVADCSGNISTKTLETITVDTVVPELTLISPKGSSSNWRWIVATDDPALGTVNTQGDFTGIEMKIVSNEDLGSIVSAVHTVYDYLDNELSSDSIISSATIDVDNRTVKIDLPDLEYGKHTFVVTVEDAFGNSSTMGDKAHEIYEVDAIVPQIEFTNIEDEDVFDESLPVNVQINVSDSDPESTYVVTAYPIDGSGNPDGNRQPKQWSGKVTTDGVYGIDIHIGDGWWRFTAEITDNHENSSEAVPVDVRFQTGAYSIALKKGYGYAVGAGPLLDGYSAEDPAWLMPTDLYECSETDCKTDFDVWSDASAGSAVEMTINGTVVLNGSTSGEIASFDEVLLTLTDVNTIAIKLTDDVTSAESFETYYLMLNDKLLELTLVNPVDCSGDEICRRLDLVDNPATTDYIELAELGYGYNDDAVPGGALDFKPSGAIVFEVENATEGSVFVESISGGVVSGIENGEAPIQYDSVLDIYYADFSNMTVLDNNSLGQKDYDLIFKVVEQPSGAVSKYLVKFHVDLLKPSAINVAGNLNVNKKTGEVSVDWTAIQGNESNLGGSAGAVHEYDIRYQDYNEGACTIATQFDAAKKPLETIAGPVPSPIVGEMTYSFFVNRIDNGKDESDPNFVEADIHRNGNKYCFAVRAVDAVYASDGTVLAKNGGVISPVDVGEVKMEWTNLIETNFGWHSYILRNIGDVDGDGKDDFAIVDRIKSSDGVNNDRAGFIKIIFSSAIGNFEIYGTDQEWLGIGVSSKADFNKDGFLDFAYTNADGDVYVHYGSSEGLSIAPSYSFVSKDNSKQTIRNMATGDYNGDGCDDILISAPMINGSGSSRGAVYIYFGRGAECSSLDPIDGDEPDIIFEGGVDNDQLGRGGIKSVGDLNDDDKTDFIFADNSRVFVAYGGDSGGVVNSYTITGLKLLPGYRAGYGKFNTDDYSDLVIGDQNSIKIYFGSETGISSAPSLTISDISPINYTYTPSAENFAMSMSHKVIDVNGDGLSDIITASSRGLLIYFSSNGELSSIPRYFDQFIGETSMYLTRILMLSYGTVYCDSTTDIGACYILNY